MKKIIILSFLTISTSIFAAPNNFNQSKNILRDKIYTNNNKTFYCGCDMVKGGSWEIPDFKSCGFEVRKNKERASRIEWEHIVPAWQFGNQKQCWRDGLEKYNSGRKGCKGNEEFEMMEADLHNLVPAIGEVNGDRSNFKATMIAEKIAPQYGQCNMVIDFTNKKAMPPQEIRGDIARIHFYMADRYNLRLSSQDIKIYTAWNNQDPVSKDELELNNKKAIYQGNSNPFVTGEKNPSDYKYNNKIDIPQTSIKPEELLSKFNIKNPKSKFSCGTKKYCKDMTNCEEAIFHLNTCGLSNLDKNNDGIPCESICK